MSLDRDFSWIKAGGHCQRYNAGHNTHCIHAKHVGRTPWGWRDAVVRGSEGRWLAVEYLLESAVLRLWHHELLAAEISVGSPVRFHEQYYVLGGPFGWLNVVVRGGLGPVPAPADPKAWAAEMTGGVQDLATGRALTLDHMSAIGELVRRRPC